MEEMMPPSRCVLISVVAMTATSALPGIVRADDALPNLSGKYRCEPQPDPCRSGQMFTVTQSGDQIEFRSDNDLVRNAKLTSRISLSGLPPWNSLGVITAEDRIEWSNGTQWRKM
jgi:hypothetical protein